MKYLAKPGIERGEDGPGWFSSYSELILVDDFRPDLDAGEFIGIKTYSGKIPKEDEQGIKLLVTNNVTVSQEICGFDEVWSLSAHDFFLAKQKLILWDIDRAISQGYQIIEGKFINILQPPENSDESNFNAVWKITNWCGVATSYPHFIEWFHIGSEQVLI